jgi:hypothetical protein
MHKTNPGSIEFFLSCVGHPHHRLKKVAAARRFSSNANRLVGEDGVNQLSYLPVD